MNSLKTHYKNEYAANNIGNYLAKYMTEHSAIVCIGTDKCIVDSLAPLVGTLLLKEKIDIDIYGTLQHPIHALNLQEYINRIKRENYENIIAIDACLSNKNLKGIIEVREGPIPPGKGIGKKLPEVGNVSIIGIVESSNKSFEDLFQEVRLSMVFDMAKTISNGISIANTMRNLILK